jgi:hypothetical protein
MARRCMSLQRRVALGWIAFSAAVLLGACGGGTGTDPNPGGPAGPLDIRSFNYSPPGPIHPGDTLTFTARILEQQVVSARVLANGESTGELRVDLHDDGVAPDVAAGDFIFSGSAVWAPELGTGIMAVSLSVQATVNGSLVQAKRLAPWLHVDP